MTKTYYFVAGIPRSGSTLLCNLLHQNPRFAATPTSGLCPLLLQTNAAWSSIPEIRASASTQDKHNTLWAMLNGFHAEIDRPVVFNKSRGWVAGFELLESILGDKPKILVTYRDIPSVLSSMEKLFRRELASPNSTAQVGQNMETIEGRLAHWTAPDQLLGSNFNRVRDCVARGHRYGLHFVDFDDLTGKPEETMRVVYEFIGEEYFQHDFNNVAQSTHENDAAHGFLDLHSIRQQVRPVKKDYREILGEAYRTYAHINYDFIG